MQPAPVEKTLSLDRGESAVLIPVAAADAATLGCVRSVLEHSPATALVVLAGTSQALERLARELEGQEGGGAIVSQIVDREGTVAALNTAIQVSAPGDVAVVLPGMRVSAGWLEGLGRAATSDSTVASATPLSLGTGALVLAGADPSDAGEAAVTVRQSALDIYPRIATIGPGCAYIRRTALELAAPLDESLSLGEALADLALRTTALGMVHVAADDVLVEGAVDGSLAPAPARGVETSGELSSDPASSSHIENPIQATIAADEQGPLRRSLDRARTALGRLSVTIDGRALNASAGGTQTYIIELILALARGGEVAVRVLVPPDLAQRAGNALASVPGVELLTYEQALADPPLSDVVHRPQQVFTPDDLTLLRLVGKRVVIGQQDLVAFHNHSYHRDGDAWRAYRRTTRLALAGADQVVFFSEHARRDALAEDLLPAGRTHVVGIGAEAIEAPRSPGHPPGGLMAEDPFLLCLGADYAHKNRPFAIRLLGALRELGWPGRLVLAGAHVPYGSSHERERELLAEHPELAGFVLDLGPIDESAKTWLYGHARALLYPTLYEGFGLLPVEAARACLPCLFAAQASLPEVAGDAAMLVPWDALASAVAVLPLLSEGQARAGHLQKLRTIPVPGWSEVARQLIAVYDHALAASPSEAAPRAWQELDRENYVLKLEREVDHHKQLAREYQDAYHSLEGRVSIGLPLIDEGGLLTPTQQRGLMRIAGRGRLGSLAVRPLGLLGRGAWPRVRGAAAWGHRRKRRRCSR
jgi:glycosyltransferase involved in cell wall biosynthesis